MRIAVFHELHNGGARKMVNEICFLLKKRHIVDLYIIDSKKNNNELKYFSHYNFFKFKRKEWKGRNWRAKLYRDTIEIYRLYALHKTIASQINGIKYDVVFIHPSQFTQAPFILRFLKLKKVYYCPEVLRIVYEQNRLAPFQYGFIKGLYEVINLTVRKLIDKQNIAKANLILVNSDYTRRNVKAAYGLRSEVVYPGVDQKFFTPSSKKKDIDILYIGQKDQSEKTFLLNNFFTKSRKELTIYHHDPGKNWVSDNAIKSLYQRAKIVVCLHKNEPFGLIPLEAASCGSVVIALNSGGYKETIVPGKTGFLVREKSGEFEAVLRKILTDSEKRSKIGRRAREYVEEKWSWSNSANLIEKYLKKV